MSPSDVQEALDVPKPVSDLDDRGHSERDQPPVTTDGEMTSPAESEPPGQVARSTTQAQSRDARARRTKARPLLLNSMASAVEAKAQRHKPQRERHLPSKRSLPRTKTQQPAWQHHRIRTPCVFTKPCESLMPLSSSKPHKKNLKSI